MLKKRIIPVLLLHDQMLFKSVKFLNPVYIGDPINAIRIFNEKEVDELILIDIDASKYNREPNYRIIESIVSECFMPLCYGGGIKTVAQANKIFSIGTEKISINNLLLKKPNTVIEFVEKFGSQSVICSIDIKKNLFGKYCVYNHVKKRCSVYNPLDYAKNMVEMGVGEFFLNMVDDDGTMHGYDINFFDKFSKSVSIPVIACGGAGSIDDCHNLLANTDVGAAAAGSMFVFHGKHKAVLISYPNRTDKFVL